MICRVDLCQKEAKAAHGMCWSHYLRERRYGHPQGYPAKPTAVERIMERTHTSEIGCWWYGTRTPDDRAPRHKDDAGRSRRVALTLWEHEHGGPLPPGSRLRRLCGTKACVRPDHYEVARRAA